MNTTVWAFKPLPELNNCTGFVECDEKLAVRLIKSGDAQDPRDGASALREIEAATPTPPPAVDRRRDDVTDDEPTYETKVVTPKRPRKPKHDAD